MELSPALPYRSASQEILHLVQLCDIHCDFEKARYRSLAWTTLIQSTPTFVYGFSHCFLPFTPTYSMSPHFFRFYTKICVYCSSLPCVLHVPCSRHLTHWIDHRPTGCRVQATKLALLKFFPSPISSSVWNPNTLSYTLYLVSVCCCRISRCSRDEIWEAILTLALSHWAGVQGLLSR
jgi:hypothetical protein